ncbi:MAG: EVE domain-containing protein, partial [Candidatus Sedimenticola sp. 6PFRAG1]
QARNMMRDEMKKGDLCFFYHSNCDVPGIVGIMEVVREGYPDHTAFDPEEHYYDPKSDPEKPRWYMVDVKYKRQLKRNISLKELKEFADTTLADCPLVRKGNRLSIMPISHQQWEFILSLE